MIMNCRNHKCTHNEKGRCRLGSVTLVPVGNFDIHSLTCVEAEEAEPQHTVNLKAHGVVTKPPHQGD